MCKYDIIVCISREDRQSYSRFLSRRRLSRDSSDWLGLVRLCENNKLFERVASVLLNP
jgi:hypothetical protein